VAEFAAASAILAADVDTARIYGRLKNALRDKGQPIPENDIWLAAIALQHDLTLVSRDDHLASVVDLRTKKP